MIGRPINDSACLGQVTEVAAAAAAHPEIQTFAGRFTTTRGLARFIRQLPQRSDEGDPDDGPHVTCDVPQRVRVGPADPNCVERSILYLAAGEVLDPRPLRQLVTISTPVGRHTYPVENGRDPVVLDPLVGRNALDAGLYLLQRDACRARVRRNAPPPVEPAALLGWVARLAREQAWTEHGAAGVAAVDRASAALGDVLKGRTFDVLRRPDVLYALARAEVAAEMFGADGRYGLAVARAALAELGIVGGREAALPGGLRELAPRQGTGCGSCCAAAQVAPELPEPPAPRDASWGSAARSAGRVARWGVRRVAQSYGLGELYDAGQREIESRSRAQAKPDFQTKG